MVNTMAYIITKKTFYPITVSKQTRWKNSHSQKFCKWCICFISK